MKEWTKTSSESELKREINTSTQQRQVTIEKKTSLIFVKVFVAYVFNLPRKNYFIHGCAYWRLDERKQTREQSVMLSCTLAWHFKFLIFLKKCWCLLFEINREDVIDLHSSVPAPPLQFSSLVPAPSSSSSSSISSPLDSAPLPNTAQKVSASVCFFFLENRKIKVLIQRS